MLAHDFVQVRRPFAVVVGALLAIGVHLDDEATAAFVDARALEDEMVRCDPELATRLGLDDRIRCSLGEPRLGARSLAFAFSFVSFHQEWLDGDLSVEPLGDHRSRLAISARTALPVGCLGRRSDEELIYLIAESTIRAFLHRLAAALELAPGAGVTPCVDVSP